MVSLNARQATQEKTFDPVAFIVEVGGLIIDFKIAKLIGKSVEVVDDLASDVCMAAQEGFSRYLEGSRDWDVEAFLKCYPELRNPFQWAVEERQDNESGDWDDYLAWVYETRDALCEDEQDHDEPAEHGAVELEKIGCCHHGISLSCCSLGCGDMEGGLTTEDSQSDPFLARYYELRNACRADHGAGNAVDMAGWKAQKELEQPIYRAIFAMIEQGWGDVDVHEGGVKPERLSEIIHALTAAYKEGVNLCYESHFA